VQESLECRAVQEWGCAELAYCLYSNNVGSHVLMALRGACVLDMDKFRHRKHACG
jgi:hypothetical protein